MNNIATAKFIVKAEIYAFNAKIDANKKAEDANKKVQIYTFI
jgi:hypothetical protein